MSFPRPTLKELVDRITNDIYSSLKIQKPLARSFFHAIAFAVAGVFHLFYGFLDWIYKQMFIDTADNENKKRHAFWAGVTLKIASFAKREVEFLGVNGSVIAAGTILVRGDGAQYVVQSDSAAVDGKITVLVLASESGSSFNIAEGETLSLQSVLSGVNGSGVVLASNAINAVDEETIESLVERALERMKNPIQGGSENDYKQWTKEVSGVTRAFVYPARMGLATIGISFLMDNEEDIIPSSAKVEEVQNYLNEKRQVNSEVFVFAPEVQFVDFEIRLQPNTEAVRREVENEIRDLLHREAEPDKTLAISKIHEAISIANGEEDHELITPSENIVPAPGKILMPRNFEFFNL